LFARARRQEWWRPYNRLRKRLKEAAIVTKKVYVTKAQKTAARMIVERSKASGKPVRSSISKIANASDSRSTQGSSLPQSSTKD